MKSIFHLAEPDVWESAAASGFYAADSLAVEGFIHCSTAEQVPGTFSRYYAGRIDLVLLEVDSAGLDVRWEAATGESFPHVYEAIPVDRTIDRGRYAGEQVG